MKINQHFHLNVVLPEWWGAESPHTDRIIPDSKPLQTLVSKHGAWFYNIIQVLNIHGDLPYYDNIQ